jgi:hypothetical protein
MNSEKSSSVLVPALCAICGIVFGGTIVGFAMNWPGNRAPLMSPTPDNKAEQAYRRSGFSDRLMTTERRN